MWGWIKKKVYAGIRDFEKLSPELLAVPESRFAALRRDGTHAAAYREVKRALAGEREEWVRLEEAEGFLVPLAVGERKDAETRETLCRLRVLEAEKEALETGCAKLTNDLKLARDERDRIQRILSQYRAVEVDAYRAAEVILKSNVDHYKEKAEKLKQEVEQLMYDGEECD